MENKILFFIFASILLIGVASASANIAYVVKDGEDKNIVDLLNQGGYKFDIIHEKNNLTLVNWSNYSAIIVGEGKFNNPADIPVNKKPSLVLDTKDIYEWGWTKYSSATSLSFKSPPKLWIYKNNYIVNNISEFFSPYDRDGLTVDDFRFFYIKDYAKVNAIVADNKKLLLLPLPHYVPKNGAVIFTLEKNNVLNKGITAEARGIFFGITNTALWSSDTKKIFKNSIQWLSEGENKAPIFSGPIPNQTWNKNGNLILDLKYYFSDPENETLIYGVYNTSQDVNINLRILGSIVYFNSTADWFGSDWIVFKATDPHGLYSISNKVILNVLERNISIPVPEIKINEFVSNPSEGNEWVEIYNPTNSDVNLSNCKIKDGADNIFNLNGNLNSKTFLAFDLSGNILNDEGDVIKLYCNNQLVDSVTYGNWNDGNVNDNTPAPLRGQSAGRYPDGKDTENNKNDFRIFNTPTKGTLNTIIVDIIPPVVELLKPENNSIFNSREINFNFSVSDNLALNLYCELYLKNNVNAVKNIINGTNGSFYLNNLADGNYFWNVRCSDGINRAFAPSDFVFNVNVPDAPVLQGIGTKTIKENETLTFIVSATDSDGEEINLSASGLPNGATFIDNKNRTGIFSWTPNLEQAGIYNITFEAKDSTGLTDKKIVNIIVTDLILPPAFDDADTCSVADKNIIVTIDKPRDGDNFEIGKEIKVRTEVENNNDKDVNLDVKSYLYDLDKDKVIEEDKNNIKIKKGENKKIDFAIKVPDDADTDDNFAIYVVAFKKNNEFCNSNFADVEIDKPDKKAVIKNFEVSPGEVRGNEIVSFNVKVENIGNDDLKDIYIEIQNQELGMDLKSEKFDLDAENKDTINLNFLIPKNTSEQTYDINAKVVYDGESEEETKELVVLGKTENIQTNATGIISTTGKIIYLDNKNPINSGNENPIVLTKTTKTGTINIGSENIIVKEEVPEIKVTLSAEDKKAETKKVAENNGINFGINNILILGIIIVVIFIIIVLIMKK